ncbi:hypothetical protein CPB84DRAFT_1725665 [Gymnopilus junonius]|uniref:BZIP domain-containing protein n=1 Tax=Gymnopilus junonius TaxID=109634 RepID=A0A9P5NSR2_GYMJU|nr:hypothetical protein CPB84DRAFT_1725665 [Gymnopilus junonius]
MSSKRGRKRNDNLPPNRARDVQRAFRARRAAHLQALEQRVSELEEENGCLRQALNLPPSSRPPLGRGPTGKDKPKIYDSSGSLQSLSLHSSRDSSSADSPASRASSHSPTAVTVSMSSRPMTIIEQDSWDDSIAVNQRTQHQHTHPEVAGPSEPSYHLAPVPIKPIQYPIYNNTFPSTSRSLSNNLYTGSITHYSHSSDRPMNNSYGSQSFNFRTEIRDESRPQYSYLQSFPSQDPNMHSETAPPPNLHTDSHPHHNRQRESPLPYPHRRSLTDPQGFSIGEGFPQLPNPAQIPTHPRTPDYLRPQDTIQLTAASRSGAYDSRLNPVP